MEAYVSSLNIRGTKIDGNKPLPMLRDRESFKAPKFVNKAEWPKDELINFGRLNGFKVLPYNMQDRYNRKLRPMQYKTIVLENEYLRAEFLTGFGGKLYSLREKATGRELMYKNHVIQIGNVAIRNAWTSGGCEWNIGQIGHTFFTCSNVFAAIMNDDDGNKFIRIYEYERIKRIFWQLDFHLPTGSKVLYSHGRIINDNDHSVPMYWWSDMAINEEEGFRVLSGSDTIVYITPLGEKVVRDPLEGKPSPYKFGYCKIEEACKIFGLDITYPEVFKWSDDYFYQGQTDDQAPWIAATYPDGFVFFNRSTRKLINKKMFSWGTHNGGRKWCDHLSEKGLGYFSEIQSGMTTTQNHTVDMPANTVWEWTEAFSCGEIDNIKSAFVEDISEARKTVNNMVDSVVSANDLNKFDSAFSTLVDRQPDEIVNVGSGFGVLESRMRKKIGRKMPVGMVFPESTIGDEELPWLYLLENNMYPEFDVDTIPPSWMTDDPRWFELLQDSLKHDKSINHSSLTQYGIMLYEMGEYDRSIEVWLKSVKLKPNALAYRNIAYALNTGGRHDEAEEYMRMALATGGLKMDQSFSEEYMKMLVFNNKYETAWEFFNSMPEDKKTDVVLMYAGQAALETGNEDFMLPLFEKELQNMREGDIDITDMWFKFHAIKEAKKRGVQVTEQLIAEIQATIEVPAFIDYRIVP